MSSNVIGRLVADVLKISKYDLSVSIVLYSLEEFSGFVIKFELEFSFFELASVEDLLSLKTDLAFRFVIVHELDVFDVIAAYNVECSVFVVGYRDDDCVFNICIRYTAKFSEFLNYCVLMSSNVIGRFVADVLKISKYDLAVRVVLYSLEEITVFVVKLEFEFSFFELASVEDLLRLKSDLAFCFVIILEYDVLNVVEANYLKSSVAVVGHLDKDTVFNF